MSTSSHATRPSRTRNLSARSPLSQFPEGPAKREAIRRALDGQDIYAYRPAFRAEYVIWDRQRDPATEARFSPQAWAAFHELALRDTLPTDGGAA